MKPHIEILPDNDTLARNVADKIQERARCSIAERGRFTLALTGGDSPVPLYQMLAEDPAYRDFPWEKTLCFFGDERHVPPDHRTSNYHQAKQKLFHTGLVPDDNIFRFRAEIPDAEEVAADYEQTLRKYFLPKDQFEGFPRFDVILLGLGANGHTASLFPCTQALYEKKRWVVANQVPELDKFRLTLTFPAINAAREIYLESIDPRKKDAVANVLKAEELNFYPYPVQSIAPVSGNYCWFLTEATAPSHQQKVTSP
jgi:6-phosphogluconolactonase